MGITNDMAVVWVRMEQSACQKVPLESLPFVTKKKLWMECKMAMTG